MGSNIQPDNDTASIGNSPDPEKQARSSEQTQVYLIYPDQTAILTPSCPNWGSAGAVSSKTI
jgi:hypothetical protein